MRHLTVLFVGWLGSSVIAGAAAGQDLPNSGLCRAVEHRLERCRSGDLSAETRTFCDRIERGFQELCGPRETILASAGAEGAALDLLRQDYLVLPIEDVVSDVFPTHLVIGPADLDDPEVIALLRPAYRVRQDHRHRQRDRGRGPQLPPPGGRGSGGELPAGGGAGGDRALRAAAIPDQDTRPELQLLPGQFGPTGRRHGSPVAARALRADTAAAGGRRGEPHR